MGEGRGQIFHLEASGQLVALEESPFELEDHFESLIADHPNLLPGDQIDPEDPRRWLVVGRQVEIPSESTSWALDLLLVDQDGIPTFVELKKGSNPELRRKVVGQMLDYAANAPIFWPPGSLRARFESRCAESARDPAATLGENLQIETLPEDFWAAVDQNLKARKIRLLFATDRMVPELRRVVEFLNQSMAEVEVLALELRRYRGGGHATLVPTVFGQTLASQEKKASSAAKGAPWTEPRHLAELERLKGPAARAVAERLLAWAKEKADQIWWGRGATQGSWFPEYLLPHKKIFPFAVWTYGQVELQFQYLLANPPFDQEQEREALRLRLNEIAGISIPPDGLNRRPSFPVLSLESPQALSAFTQEIERVVARIVSHAT